MGKRGKTIEEQVRAAVEEARVSASTHVASAMNVGGKGHSTSVYSDGEVAVVTRDGQTEVIRHREEGGVDDAAPPTCL